MRQKLTANENKTLKQLITSATFSMDTGNRYVSWNCPFITDVIDEGIIYVNCKINVNGFQQIFDNKIDWKKCGEDYEDIVNSIFDIMNVDVIDIISNEENIIVRSLLAKGIGDLYSKDYIFNKQGMTYFTQDALEFMYVESTKPTVKKETEIKFRDFTKADWKSYPDAKCHSQNSPRIGIYHISDTDMVHVVCDDEDTMIYVFDKSANEHEEETAYPVHPFFIITQPSFEKLCAEKFNKNEDVMKNIEFMTY